MDDVGGLWPGIRWSEVIGENPVSERNWSRKWEIFLRFLSEPSMMVCVVTSHLKGTLGSYRQSGVCYFSVKFRTSWRKMTWGGTCVQFPSYIVPGSVRNTLNIYFFHIIVEQTPLLFSSQVKVSLSVPMPVVCPFSDKACVYQHQQ